MKFNFKKDILFPLLKALLLLLLPSIFCIFGFLKQEVILDYIGLSLSFMALIILIPSLISKTRNNFWLASYNFRYPEISSLTLFIYSILIAKSCHQISHLFTRLPVYWISLALLVVSLGVFLYCLGLEIHFYVRYRQSKKVTIKD
jgi:hypothetical protein